MKRILVPNTKTGFQSYFLRFDSGSRIELTTKQHLHPGGTDTLGYTHLAMALKSQAEVDAYAQRVVSDGFPLLSGPRTTGDGYYEAVIQDPEGNLIERSTRSFFWRNSQCPTERFSKIDRRGYCGKAASAYPRSWLGRSREQRYIQDDSAVW